MAVALAKSLLRKGHRNSTPGALGRGRPNSDHLPPCQRDPDGRPDRWTPKERVFIIWMDFFGWTGVPPLTSYSTN